MTESHSFHAHQIPIETRRLYSQTRAVLEGSGRFSDLWLEQRLETPAYGKIRVVATGLYSSGKSSILRALTGDTSIEVDADITTATATEYDWGDVLLVDTPGVAAGVASHDALAEQALRDADLVMFVVSVSLPDDDAAAHLRHVAVELGRSEDMVFVVNKRSLSRANPGIRQESVERVLSTIGVQMPIVVIDALDELDAQESGDQQDRAELHERSHIDDLVAELNALNRKRGSTAQLEAPLIRLMLALDEADVELRAEGPEKDVRRAITASTSILATARLKLLNRIGALESDAKVEIVQLGERLAEQLTYESGVTQEDVEQFEAAALTRAYALRDAIETEFRTIGEWIDRQSRELNAGPTVEVVREAANLPPTNFETGMEGVGGPPASSGGSWSERSSDLNGWLEKAAAAGLFATEKMGDPRTGPGHAMILKIGHAFKYKFKPWEAVRWSSRIGKAGTLAAKWLPLAGVLLEGGAQVFDARAEKTRLDQLRAKQTEIRDQVQAAAEFLIEQARLSSIPTIDENFKAAQEPFERARRELDDMQGIADQAIESIAGLRLAAHSLRESLV